MVQSRVSKYRQRVWNALTSRLDGASIPYERRDEEILPDYIVGESLGIETRVLGWSHFSAEECIKESVAKIRNAKRAEGVRGLTRRSVFGPA